MSSACGQKCPVTSRSATKSPVRHLPLFRDTARCFPAWRAQARVGRSGFLVDQRRFGPSRAVRSIGRRIESDGGVQLVDDPSILTRGDMWRTRHAVGKEKVRWRIGAVLKAFGGTALPQRHLRSLPNVSKRCRKRLAAPNTT